MVFSTLVSPRNQTQPPVQQPPAQPPAPQPPAPQPPAPDTVQLATFWQDPFVGPAETTSVLRSSVGTELANGRVAINDNRPKVQPDSSGNFLTEPGSDGESQVNAQVVTTRTLGMWEGYRNGTVEWGFGSPVLEVIPHKQPGMNAYYSRWEASTNYFFQRSEELNTDVKTANSLDVVAHETGHAILDGIKPGFFSTNDKETKAFHEAFGDCSAMMASLQDPVLNERIIAQTGGDLRQENFLAHLAEQFGKARKLATADTSDDDRAWLRNSLNSFTYVPPETLGDGRGDDFTLGGEIHSFARLFAGAFYDCLDAAYQQGMQEQALPPAQALKWAADTVGPLFVQAVEHAPANRGRFKTMGLGLIGADQESNGGKLGDAFKKIFLDRKIITPQDLQSETERKANLPKLTVDHNFSSPEEATAYVRNRSQQLGLPAGVDLQTVALSHDKNGAQVVNLLYSQEVPVSVAGLEGLSTDVTGGVTLSFDAQGKLSEFRHNAITPQAIQEEMDGIASMQHQDEILQDTRGGMVYTRTDGKPYQAAVRGGKLVRVPSSSCEIG